VPRVWARGRAEYRASPVRARRAKAVPSPQTSRLAAHGDLNAEDLPWQLPLRRRSLRQFGTKAGHHLFCKHCGVRSFERGYVEQIGGDYVSVNVMALDDADLDEIVEAPVRYANGRDDAWWAPPAETRHL
jgi:hypothetical protein